MNPGRKEGVAFEPFREGETPTLTELVARFDVEGLTGAIIANAYKEAAGYAAGDILTGYEKMLARGITEETQGQYGKVGRLLETARVQLAHEAKITIKAMQAASDERDRLYPHDGDAVKKE